MKTITQQQIGAMLGIRGGHVSEILAGKRKVSPRVALRFEAETGVSRLTWLFGSPEDLRRELEEVLHRKISFRRGRPPGKIHEEDQSSLEAKP